KLSTYEDYVGVSTSSGSVLADHLQRAGRLIERQVFPEAMKELEAAERIFPDDPNVLVNLGSLAARLGDTARAIRVLAHAAGTAPRDVEVRFNLGLLYWRTGRSADARREWEAVIRHAPASDPAGNARRAISGKAR